MVNTRSIAISCAGALMATVATSSLVSAEHENIYRGGSNYTLTGLTPLKNVNVSIVPSSSFGQFSGSANADGSFSFQLPISFSSGEYTVLATDNEEALSSVSSIVLDSPKKMYRLHSDYEHNEPQQTCGGGVPAYLVPSSGYGKESITAIATTGAGSSAGAQIGLVAMASLLGAIALF